MAVLPPEIPQPDRWLLLGICIVGIVLGVMLIVLGAQLHAAAPCQREPGGIVCF